MIIKQNLTIRSKNLGYLTVLTDLETDLQTLVVSKFKGKDPTHDQMDGLQKLQRFMNDSFDLTSLYDVRIDNNVYLELLEQEWNEKYVLNIEKDFENPFESVKKVQEENKASIT
jgi:hypothetical protein